MGPWPLAPVAHAALTLLVTAEKEIAGAEVCAAAAGMLDHTDPPSHRLPIGRGGVVGGEGGLDSVVR